MTVTASGIGLTLLHGGPVFARLHQIHCWSTFAITPVIAGHLLVVSGLLPGYRGVWRAMHLGGRASASTARRLWPAWTEHATTEPSPRVSGSRRRERAAREPSRGPTGP
jgi:formate dehydrogenase subunit gamma